MDWLVHVPDQGWLQQTTGCFTRGCCSPRHLYWGVVFASRPWSYIISQNIIAQQIILTELFHKTFITQRNTMTELYNYTTIQLYNIFTTVYPVLRHVLFTFSFTNVTLPKYVSIRQGQDEQIDIIVTDMIEMVARNRQRNIKFTC